LALGHDVSQGVDQFESAEGQRQHGIDAAARVAGQGVLRHGQDDHRDIQARVAQLLDELGAFEFALEEQIHHDHVRAQLPGRVNDLRAVGQDLEQLHLRLDAQQVADVLAYLRNVFRD